MPTLEVESESDMSLIANALRTAAQEFIKHASDARKTNNDRLAKQFHRQAADALRIAEKIESEGY